MISTTGCTNEGQICSSHIGPSITSFALNSNESENHICDSAPSYCLSVQPPTALDLSPNVSLNKNSHYEALVTSYGFPENDINRYPKIGCSYPTCSGVDAYSKSVYASSFQPSYSEMYEVPNLVMASMASSSPYYESSNTGSNYLPSLNLGQNYTNLVMPQPIRAIATQISNNDSDIRIFKPSEPIYSDRLTNEKFRTNEVSHSSHFADYELSYPSNDSTNQKDDSGKFDEHNIRELDLNNEKLLQTKHASPLSILNTDSGDLAINKNTTLETGTFEKLKPLKKSQRIRNARRLVPIEYESPAEMLEKSKKRRKVTCKVCSAQFSEYHGLKIHFYTHTGERPFTCNFCGKKFTTNSKLSVHERKHTGEKPHKCQTCQLSFRLISTLKSHILTHTGDRPFQCDICAASFTQRAALKRHKVTHDSGHVHPFSCHLCDKTFRDRFSFKKHLTLHKCKEKHTCGICQQGFNSNKKLVIHLMTHNDGPTPYKCNKCPSAFKSQKSLRQHKRRIHERGEELRCEDCDATFKRKESFRAHKKVHTGDNLVKCPMCEAFFNNSVTLKKHVKKHSHEIIDSNEIANVGPCPRAPSTLG